MPDIIGLPLDFRNIKPFKNSPLNSIGLLSEDGSTRRIEYDPESPYLEISAGEGALILYEDGTKAVIGLKKDIENNPKGFLANQRNIVNAMESYNRLMNDLDEEKTPVTQRHIDLANRHLMILNRHLGVNPPGTVLKISVKFAEAKEAWEYDSDPIPGFLLRFDRIRCEEVRVNEKSIITSVKLSLSKGSMESLEYNIPNLAQLPKPQDLLK